MENYVPGRPQYQMINPLSAIMTPPPDNAAPKHVSKNVPFDDVYSNCRTTPRF